MEVIEMQILAHIPDDLGNRFKAAVPARKRSAFIADLLRKALPEEDDVLYRLALSVEDDQSLNAGMEGWDATVADGLADHIPVYPPYAAALHIGHIAFFQAHINRIAPSPMPLS